MRVGIAASMRAKTDTSWDESADYGIDLAKYGDEHGYANIWMTEHHFTEVVGAGTPALLLAHIAAVTKRIRLGTSVVLIPFYNPVRLAEEMLLVDRLSRGRLDLGIGRGSARIEAAVLCADVDRSREIFDDGFEVLRHAFRGEEFQFEGNYWKFPNIQIFPPPVQRIENAGNGHADSGVPFYMPITSPRYVEFVAKNGIIPLVGYADQATVADSLGQYRQHAEAAGVPKSRLEWILDRVATNRFVLVADSQAEAEELTRAELAHPNYSTRMYALPVGDPGFSPILPDLPPVPSSHEELMAGSGPVFGTRDEVIDQIQELERIGVKHISVSFAFKSPLDVSRRRAERFTEEVLPHVT